ncbi:uncharacterized protein LOC129943517 [Eupeodes corollae]|uniref:uncharacterized protein LOC129943517 n=1 Tax=Eupeodes corollae TaxID=290404 RepID=UPI00248FE0EB|nr:uncharacterized protein LOC129943517 [Eupeodes corollae]
MSDNNLSELSTAQLKSWLKSLGQKTNGNKSTLILRLESVPVNERGSNPPETTETSKDIEAAAAAYGDNESDNDPEASVQTKGKDKENDGNQHQEDDDDVEDADNKMPTTDQKHNDNKQNNFMKKEIELMQREICIQRKEIELLRTENECLKNERKGEENKLSNELQKREKECLHLKKELQVQREQNEILKKECDKKNIEKENEMQNDLVSAKKKEPSNECYISNINMVKELLSDYAGEGDNFSLWQSQIKNIQSSYNLDNNNMRALIAAKLKGKALQWLHSKPDIATISIDSMLEEMRTLFDNRTSKLEIRRKFESRKWLSSEIFQNYFHDKLILANKMELAEEELLDCIIEGIPDHHLRVQAKMHRFVNRNQLLEAFSGISLPKPFNAGLRPSNEGEQKLQIRCFNCNSLGHLASDCKKPKREIGACHACGQFGHFAAACSAYKKKNHVVHHVDDDDDNQFNA